MIKRDVNFLSPIKSIRTRIICPGQKPAKISREKIIYLSCKWHSEIITTDTLVALWYHQGPSFLSALPSQCFTSTCWSHPDIRVQPLHLASIPLVVVFIFKDGDRNLRCSFAIWPFHIPTKEWSCFSPPWTWNTYLYSKSPCKKCEYSETPILW